MPDRHSKAQVNRRVKIILFLFSLVILAIFVRLLWIQVIQASFYQRLALRQRLEEKRVDSERGKIYDRTGNELAINVSAETIIAYPERVETPAKTAEKLAGVLSIDEETIYNRLNSGAYLIYLDRQVDANTFEKVKNLNLPGISSISEPMRKYPRDELAGQLLGFTGVDNYGLEGLEYSYDRFLSGEPGINRSEIDAVGGSIPGFTEAGENIDMQEGLNLHLTIDEVIQYFAEEELKAAGEKYNIEGGSVTVMDPNGGDILAMASESSFNPNHFEEYDEKDWQSKAVTDSFEPGSVFKIFTAATFLEEGYYDFSDILYGPGSIEVENESINCWSKDGHGRQNMVEVFANSCNPGFVQMGLSMDREEFAEGLRRFNFGRSTGVELPGEASGRLIPRRFSDLEQATLSFGHGISATPLQLISAGAALAGEGMLYKPRLVKRLTNSSGETAVDFSPQQIRQAVSLETAEKTRKLMREAVREGTGTEAQIPGFDIAGKTGTSRHYGDEEIYDTSFLGFLPGDNPEIVILVVLNGLEGDDYFASENAVPVFKNIAERIITYKNISPAGASSLTELEIAADEGYILGDFRGLSAGEAGRTLRSEELNVKLIGEGETVKRQIPTAESEVYPGSTVYLFLDESYEEHKVMVPDFRDLSPHEAEELAGRYGLFLDGIVSGEVSAQYPNPGKRVEAFTQIEVE